MREELLQKYNVPVPRYTSYPPANYFHEQLTASDYEAAISASNQATPRHISFYVHIPFCRHLCHYCGCNSFPMANAETIERYIAAIHKEIDKTVSLLDPSRKIAQIHYGGGSPTAIPIHYIKELNEHMMAGFTTIEQPEIAIECHPGYLDEAGWEALTEAGFTRFSLGVQDLDEKVLKTVNRRPSLLPLEEVFSILRSKGARINMDFIYGLPLQTADGFKKMMEKAATLAPNRLVTFSYAHVPWVNKRQMILEKAGLPDSDEKSRMYDNASAVLHNAGYHTVGMDHFVREDDELFTALQTHQLHRNFQGYCTRRTTGQVYAFGVTGISQLNAAYAQNSKDLQTYMEQIEAGHFATAKGYALNKEEQITREVIETLMCNNRIDWDDLAERLALPVETIREAIAYDDNRLCELASDGLIYYNEHMLEVTEEGKPFVRNIAASFDKLMLHSTQSFSKPV